MSLVDEHWIAQTGVVAFAEGGGHGRFCCQERRPPLRWCRLWLLHVKSLPTVSERQVSGGAFASLDTPRVEGYRRAVGRNVVAVLIWVRAGRRRERFHDISCCLGKQIGRTHFALAAFVRLLLPFGPTVAFLK